MKICKYCNSFFEDKKHKNKTFCSRECWGKYHFEKNSIACEVCGKKFVPKDKRINRKNGVRFCSWKCRIKSKSINIKCKKCGKNFRVTPYAKDKKFCSSKCSTTWKRGKDESKWSVFVCKECGKKFEDYSYRKTSFCSSICKNRYAGKIRGLQLLKPNSSKSRGMNWKAQSRLARKRDNYTCQVCGKNGWVDKFKVQVHHIIPYRLFNGDYEKANELSNLISLCPSCHPKVESGTIHLKLHSK